ncbi:multidrug efflux SMR transporter [Grimontia kaedaensis]|uniref:Guanidinium exporter n=1 Tax=Grimontia kaedaensis TaxID=2872157 RepID=A0ABY4WQ18_9GAMM|nr:multidrug efflux SMR transporter [Grimontia kaedaensis]USH01681.1 multidrug efflux SMR transporter [Grimontia kaedaensis]
MTSTTKKSSNTHAWLMLILAGIFEIGYALSVGGSEAFTVLSWSISAVIFFLLTLYCLSVSLKTIDVGIGYAVWAGIGAIGASIFGAFVFDQMLTLMQAFWLAVIILGVIWLKLSSSEKLQETEHKLATR